LKQFDYLKYPKFGLSLYYTAKHSFLLLVTYVPES
jgi:hypothetical protein